MAHIYHKWCNECQSETQHSNSKCNKCVERKHRMEIALWNAKTTDEKLLELRIRIECLEVGPPRYN